MEQKAQREGMQDKPVFLLHLCQCHTNFNVFLILPGKDKILGAVFN